jgi:hypothetical protein
MKLEETHLNCQIPCLELVAEDVAEVPPQSLSRRMKLMIRRRLSPSRERAFKSYTNDRRNRFCELTGRRTKPSDSLANVPSEQLQARDWVRVRSLEEIEATLNHWRQVKGCAFMPEMAEYCGTTQRVLKPMNRFVDERDLRVKKSTGIILLEGVMCQGTAEFGGCDRSCFVFWREEWLEKVDEESAPLANFPSAPQWLGDWVRVRSLEEIEATLDQSRQVRGCSFMPKMAEYCGTTQRVLKPMNRFVDERDLRVKKSTGIILLEGVMCQGTAEFGGCDRACYYFWREEWLEKVDEQSA